MTLGLEVISYRGQPLPTPLRLEIEARSATIGRKPENDLALPDPDRVISGTHLRVEYQGGQYFLLDQSTNGTYLNGAPEPLPKGKPIPLSDGDLIQIGEYQLSVRMTNEEAIKTLVIPDPSSKEPIESTPDSPAPPPSPFQSDTLDPLALIGGDAASSTTSAEPAPPPGTPVPDPLVPPVASQPADGASAPEDPLAAAAGNAGLGIPDDFDLLADLNPEQPAQSDHTPIEHQAFTPPEVAPESQSPVTPQAPPTAPEDGAGIPPSVPDSPAAAPATPTVEASSPPPPTAPHRVGTTTSEPARQPSASDGVPPQTAAPATPPPPAEPSTTAAAGDQLMEALYAGLGQHPERSLAPGEQEALLRTLGNLVRLTIDGLLRTLTVRHGFKQELRLEMTTIRPLENNPLKFSINAQDALQRMLFLRQQGFMGPEQALEEAFHDIMAHEMAMVAGLQAALQALLDRFDPKALEQHFKEFGALTGALPLLREAKYWDVFKKTYAQVRRDAEEGFMHLFGEAFNRAYEEQVRRLKTDPSSAMGRQP